MASTVSARRAGGGQGATGDEPGNEATSVNEVSLVGRLAASAEQRELPSGDTLVTFRLIIDRPEGRSSSGGRSARSPKVDTVDCAAWRADVRRAALRWVPGARVEVHGALRRRFWRTAAGAASRVEVEVASARRRG
ncbi:MAG: single-stranded DNA-binding protein [Candidatus Nanopelagicales bacterium]